MEDNPGRAESMVDLLWKVADKGSVRAQFELGKLYLNGCGSYVKVDFDSAYTSLNSALKGGEEEAGKLLEELFGENSGYANYSSKVVSVLV